MFGMHGSQTQPTILKAAPIDLRKTISGAVEDFITSRGACPQRELIIRAFENGGEITQLDISPVHKHKGIFR